MILEQIEWFAWAFVIVGPTLWWISAVVTYDWRWRRRKRKTEARWDRLISLCEKHPEWGITNSIKMAEYQQMILGKQATG